MTSQRIAEIVNTLVDMLMNEGVDSAEILDKLELTEFEKGWLNLEWLERE